MKIIAVDDEALALALLRDAIDMASPKNEVVCFSDGDEALQYAEGNSIGVAFLDVELPGMSGIELARELIELQPQINIIFVTGFDRYMSEAFDMYASGYISKPVQAQRVKKELEHLRYPLVSIQDTYRVAQLVFDLKAMRVTGSGEDLQLSPKEYAMLRLLATPPGVFITPEMLYSAVWRNPSYGDIRTIYPHMSKLRKKLDKGRYGVDIEQQKPKGYRLFIL